MQRLDCVGDADHLADAGRPREERDDMLPDSAPSQADRRIGFADFGLGLLDPEERHVGILGPVDRFNGGQIALRSFEDTMARLLRVRARCRSELRFATEQ